MRTMLIVGGLLALAGTVPTAQPADTANFSVPVVSRKLPNGLRVVVSEEHSAPVVTVEVMYGIGFRIEPKDRTGFAHLFEHMMFQGSEHVGKFEHVRIVNQNGGILNGSTRFDHTNYFEVMPSNALETAIWLEAATPWEPLPRSGSGGAFLRAPKSVGVTSPPPAAAVFSVL